ncbi:protein mono-ADP-ribosyltransferase PARP14-like isoform X1 [Littorina saxatilis]|uniref:protein mono-ADP-ribosyltransferase PARP14-like isoform X1 n=1 Tax=Littorina saxatilis TaxID=31220 RepID=UPI0038B4C93B
MSLASGLLSSCILAKGFPPDICPAEVARAVFTNTGATIDKIAPSPSADSRSPGWLLYLHSHDDQINCLHHHRTFTVALNDESYPVKLDLPPMSLNASELDWIVINKGEDKMDSVDSEALFGSGGAGSADPNSNRTDSSQPSTGSSQGYPQQQDPPFRGQYMGPGGPGNEWQYPQFPQYPPQAQGYPYQQGPTGHLYSHGSDPNYQGHGANYPTAGRGMEYPNNSPFPQHLMGRGRGMQFDFYNQQRQGQHFHQRPPANPEGGARAESLPQAMGDLNLKQEPFPHCDSFENQPEEYYGDAIGSPERDDFQSDFVVLGDTGPQESPQHHHRFHLQVTDLPDAITTKELVDFFEDRKESGGGPVTDVNHNQSTRSAAIYFFDSDSIERITKKVPLLLKNKKITVKPVSAEQQKAETEVNTVEIRGLNTEEDREMCILYFENPRKGGGDIENSNWDDKEKILYITFEKPEVAKSVASKGHKVGGNVLEVMLYTPPVEVEPEEMELSCTVEVRGFDPAKEADLYEMYFSSPKKGGDDIADLRFSKDKSVMYITFESPEVADRVASLPHKVGGQLLEVMIAPIEDPTPPSTVMVKGLDLRKDEVCRLYFENPRKGGGDIAELVVDEDQEAIFITFEDPEVAQKVITMPHKIGGHDLEVSLYTPKKAAPMRHKSQEPAEEEEEAPLRTVVFLIGQETSESEDTYALYFESPRHGGGEVEEVNIDKDKGLVYVTFEEPTVAERVAGKTHRIAGRQVEVTLFQPPKPRPTYSEKLLFKNIADSTTRDCLCMYLERITGLDPAEVLYGDEVGTVLVTFAEEPDLVKTAQFCQKRKLEGRQLTVAKVPISNCLLVENLNDRTTEDTVELYFENKRSGGGAVEKVEMVPEENKCFVFFEDHDVLDGVLQKPHKIDGAPLSVKRYMECLGQSGGSQDPTAFTAPKPVVMTNVDPYKVAFLRQSQEIKAGFLQQLSNSHAEVKFEGDNLSIACSLNPSVPKARILARTWATDVQQVAGEFLGMIDVLKRHLVQQIWPEVETAVRSANIASPKGAAFFPVPEESAFVVVGMKSMAKELLDKINVVASKVEEEIERKSQEVTETNSKLEPYKLRLLLAMGFQIEAGKRHEGLRIDINIRNNSIVFQGLLKDVKESQVEMYETLQAVTREKITEMSDMQKKLLDSKETKPYIVQKFKADKIAAVWEIGQKGEVMVHAFNDKNLVKAVHIIKKSVPEHVCQLNPESAQLLISQDWKSLVNRQISAHPGLLLIAPSHDNQQVFIACTDNIMHGVVEDIEMFLRENTIYSQVMRFSPSRQVFIHSHWQGKLQNIGERLRAYRVQLSLKEAGTEMYVKGTEQGLQEVRKNLEQLGEKIICHEQVCTDQGTVKLLNSNCEKDLKMIGRGSHCVLGLQREPADLQVVQSSHPVAASPGQMGGTANTAASVQLPSGVSVSVMQGDITQMPVDAIVNAANARMDHVGGLARDIVDKGGDTIQAECYKNLKTRANQLKEGDVLVSGSGRLPCKIIIHAVGPMYKGGRAGEEECLYETVMKCMETVNSDGHSSIAIPAISTGIFGYPARESTRVIVEAVKAFLDSHRRCTVKNVYFCHVGGDIVQLFTTAVQTTFPSARSTSTAYKPAAVPRKGTAFGQPARQFPMSGGGAASSHRVINVSIISGELAKQTVDVIVNSTSNGLDLQNGAVSSSILKAAGVSLQDECKTKYPGGIQAGDIACTMGHNLNCMEVFHLVLCNYSNPSAAQLLGRSMTKCLVEASKRHYTSIAFPVLGTGNLGYPAPTVAHTMLDAIDKFQNATPSTTLRDARIVVYHTDVKILQEFKKAQSGMGGASFAPSLTRGSGARHNRVFAETVVDQSYQQVASGGAASSTSNAEFDIGGLRFVIKKGDITEEDTDAIVNSTNSQLDLSRGGVAGALKKKCGSKLESECRSKAAEIQLNGVVQTKAYNLRCKIILHVDADTFSNSWEDGIEACLKYAESKGVRSIAMPALGTGIGLSAGASASALFNTVVKMYANGSGSVGEIRVVLFDKKMIPPFVSAVQAKGEKHNKSRKGFFNYIKSAFTGSTAAVKQTVDNPVQEEATIFVYAESRKDVDQALTSLDELVKEKFTRKEITDDFIMSLGPQEELRIQAIAQRHNVEVQIHKFAGRIVGDGMHHNVFDCMQEISNVIREVERKQQQKEAASMLANMVQWCYLEVTTTGTEAQPYAPKENHVIETAFQDKKKTAQIEDQDKNVYIIDFDSMMEYPKSDFNDSVSVIRRDKIKDMATGQVPENWEKHLPNDTVKLVPLPATDAEYQTVVTGFQQTVGNVAIVAVKRIQNPHLYHQYVAKKAHLEKQNPPGTTNEKSLWHGTSSDAIQNINHHGFNRSFCGKNATVHGQGVYFAVNANYSASATYSPPDPSGTRHVYLCKVLVGVPTKGSSSMRVLPMRQGHILYDSAVDNVQNPSMYVIFNDTQAYPEYLIDFQ